MKRCDTKKVEVLRKKKQTMIREPDAYPADGSKLLNSVNFIIREPDAIPADG